MKKILLVSLVLVFASAACRQSQDDGSKSVAADYTQVDALLKKREFATAIDELEALRTARGPEPELILRLGGALVLQGDPSRAVIRYRECLDQHPESSSVHAALGAIYLELNQLPRARQALEKARALGAPDDQTALRLGTCLGQLEDFEGATREFERARAAGTEDKLVDYNLALILGRLGRREEARAKLEAALERDAHWPAAQRELARLLIELYPTDPTQCNRAMDLAMDARDGLPDDWRVHEILGDGFMLANDYDAAVSMYTEALKLGQNPKPVEAKFVLARRKQIDLAKAKPSLAEPTAAAEPAPR